MFHTKFVQYFKQHGTPLIRTIAVAKYFAANPSKRDPMVALSHHLYKINVKLSSQLLIQN